MRNDSFENRFRDYLESRFELYVPTHKLMVVEHTGASYVSYCEVERWRDPEQTYFDLQVKGDWAHVNSIQIRRRVARKGHGQTLVGCIEQMAKELGASWITTDPSGQGKVFWPKMGYVLRDDGMTGKDL